MEPVIQAVALALASVISAVAAALTPVLIAWLRERILTSRMARINAAAETVAAEMAEQVGPLVERGVAAGVERLRARLPDTIRAMSPSDETLAGLIVKARARVAPPAEVDRAVDALTRRAGL